jgi:hypothetical protein
VCGRLGDPARLGIPRAWSARQGLVGRRRIGIVLSDHAAEDGAFLFIHACRMGLEGIVSTKLSAPYRSGPLRENPDSRAMISARVAEW